MIYVVGIGPGNVDYMSRRAIKILEECQIVIGFKRALDSMDFIEDSKKFYMKTLSDVDKFLVKNPEISYEKAGIIASGDPTFYGITNYIKSKAEVDFEVIPGLSSFQYLMCKVKMPWNNAYLGSLHGRHEEFIKEVKNNELTVWLTDKDNNPAALCQRLVDENINSTVIIGENLSYDDERILRGSPDEFVESTFNGLNIFVVSTK